MKILVITQLYPEPDDAGDNKPTRTVEFFSKEWVQMGHEVVVAHCSSKFPLLLYLIPLPIKKYISGVTSNIFFPISSREKKYHEVYGIRVYRFPMFKPYPGCGYSKKSMYKTSQEIALALDRIEFVPDLVVGHFANPSTELVSLLSGLYKAKSSIVFHNDCNERNIKKYRLDEAVKGIGAIGARSVVESERITGLLGLKHKPFICCSGVPNDVVKTAESTCTRHNFVNGIRYLCVAALIKRKNVDVVVKAFKKTSSPEDTLTLIGGGPQEDYIRELIKDDHRIIMLGQIPREQVFLEMKRANVFTLISYHETYGMVYIEAMLQGCITIASKNGGFDGIIVDGENGYLCEAGNQNDLERIYSGIKELTTEKRNLIGQNAIDTAVHYSEKEVAEKYLQDILVNQR